MSSKPVPVVDDRETAGFFEAGVRGAIGIQFCSHCGVSKHLPRRYCSACGSWAAEWRDIPARGRVYSYTTVEHQAHVAFDVPYTVLLIELDDVPNVRVVGYVDGRRPVEIGTPAHATFDEVRDGVVLARWQLDAPGAAP